MDYCGSTLSRVWTLNPESGWGGKYKTFKFSIKGMSDSYYSKCTITQMNVSGYATFLVVSPITVKSEMQDIAIISVTEAESVAKVH